jgi:putative transposase
MKYRRATVPGASYFFTLITYQRVRLFSDTRNVVRWHDAVSNVQSKRPFVIEAEVVMPDHLHVLMTLPEGDAGFGTRIRLIKTAFTKNLLMSSTSTMSNESRISKGERNVWQRRYWEHVIRDEKDFQDHVNYIHINPVKHGLTERPGDWPHSTFSAWMERGAYEPWWGGEDMPPLPDWVGRE